MTKTSSAPARRASPKKRAYRSPMLGLLDDLIVRGRLDSARRELRRISPRRIRRGERAEWARLARRAGLPQLALSLIHPLLRGPRPAEPPASAEERTEYALALTLLGATEEAQWVLAPLEEGKHPGTLFARASLLVARWDYGESIPLLEAYRRAPELTDYQRAVAEVNLAAAYVEEKRADEAAALLQRLLPALTLEGRALLRGNALELLAQVAVENSNWGEAQRYLDEAVRLLRFSSAKDGFFLEKLEVRLRLHREGKEAAPALAAFREKAAGLGHAETVRDCDRWAAWLLQDREAFLRAYFGTPHEAFRRRLEKGWRGEPPPPFHRWTLQAGEGSTLDATTGEGGLAPNRLPQRTLRALCLDWYRPAPVATLFQRLFPGEYFNPDSSPVRVHQAVSRLRRELTAIRSPLRVVVEGGAFRLTSRGPAGIRLPRPGKPHSWVAARLTQIFGDGPFSAAEAARNLGVPPRTARRRLEEEVGQGTLARLGRGKLTRYRVTPLDTAKGQ